MADLEGVKVAKTYHTDIPFANQNGFYLKGCNSLDWGMKRHMANIFNPKSGNTVMFAFDHGYFMGSTSGLERLDLLLPKLAPYVDCFMGTRGAIRTCVPPELTNAIALRVSSGSSMLQDDLSFETVAVDIEDAIRMNSDCMAVQTFIGADGQLSSIDNLSQVVNAGMRYSIPTLGVCAVAKTWNVPTASSNWQHASSRRWASRLSKPTTVKTLRKSWPHVLSRLWSRAAKSFRNPTRSISHTMLCARARTASIWAAISSRAHILSKWRRQSAKLSTRAIPTNRRMSFIRI